MEEEITNYKKKPYSAGKSEILKSDSSQLFYNNSKKKKIKLKKILTWD